MDETKLLALQAELKTYFDKAAVEQKSNGTMLETTQTSINALQKQVDAIDVKMAEKHAAAVPDKTFEETLRESESIQRLVKDRSGKAVLNLKGREVIDLLERKTTITSAAVGLSTTGVLQIERIPGIVPEARQALTVRDLLVARPTVMQVIDFVKVNAAPKLASPQVEAADKAENVVTFAAASQQVRTIATWIPASRQILDDFSELAGYLNQALPYYVNLMEELELLSGDNTGVHLNGLITQATAFSTGLLSAPLGWNKIDIVGRVIQQITAAKELQPTFIVCHPTDWWGIRLTKDSYGRYILGDPQTNVAPSLFGLSVVPTVNITSGTFLVGSGSPIASEIRDRMEMQVEISTEHSDYFVKNLVAVRAEKRLALVVKRPASYITGTFTTSP